MMMRQTQILCWLGFLHWCLAREVDVGANVDVISSRSRDLQQQLPIEESRPCIPFDNVNQERKDNVNTDPRCLQNRCDSGCCRIFEWLVCDEENLLTHLQCACNANTVTPAPTSAPTITSMPTSLPPSPVPTPSPTTTAPTRTPSLAPTTRAPSPAPSLAPTTRAPTTSPSSAPTTLAPTSLTPTTSAPTNVPSMSPSTNQPTEEPTPAPTTQPPSLAPTTKPPSLAPSPNPTVAATPEPTTAAPSMAATTAKPSPEPTIRTDAPTAGARWETREGLDQDGNSVRTTSCIETPENVQLITYTNYTYDYQVLVASGIEDQLLQSSSDGPPLLDVFYQGPIHDAVVNEFFSCNFLDQSSLFIYQSAPHQVVASTTVTCGSTDCSQVVVRVTEGLWTYSPNNTRQRQRQRQRQLQDSSSLEFIKDITSFVETQMESGELDPATGILQATFLGNVRIGGETQPTLAPTSMAPTSAAPTSAAPTSTAPVTVAVPTTPTGGVDGVEAPTVILNGEEPPDDGKSSALPVILGVTGVLLAILLFAVARRRNKSQDSEVVETLDLDDERGLIDNRSSRMGQDSVLTPTEKIPRNSNVDDMYYSTQSSSAVAVEDPYTSASPPKRSERPPLFSQDELHPPLSSPTKSFDMRPAVAAPSERSYRANDTVIL